MSSILLILYGTCPSRTTSYAKCTAKSRFFSGRKGVPRKYRGRAETRLARVWRPQPDNGQGPCLLACASLTRQSTCLQHDIPVPFLARLWAKGYPAGPRGREPWYVRVSASLSSPTASVAFLPLRQKGTRIPPVRSAIMTYILLLFSAVSAPFGANHHQQTIRVVWR